MNNHARSILLTVMLVLGATGCGDDSTPATAGQCANLKSGTGTDGDVLTAIATHVPVTMTTYCTSKATFLWEGGKVDLVYIAYGSPLALPVACPGGNCANTICALGDGNGINNGSGYSWLFDAVWINNEPPLTISQECPAIALNATGDTATQCTAPPVSGRTHPVMSEPHFRGFLNAQPIPRQFAVCGRNLPQAPAP